MMTGGFEGSSTVFDTVVANTGDTQQRIVCGLFESARIENELVVEVK